MEIERKYLIDRSLMPTDCLSRPFHQIEQAYLSTDPVVRVRREDDSFYLTYKSRGKIDSGRVQPASDRRILRSPSVEGRRDRADEETVPDPSRPGRGRSRAYH